MGLPTLSETRPPPLIQHPVLLQYERLSTAVTSTGARSPPHIRRLEVENKATANEKAATTEAAIEEQLAKVLARDAALQRETEQQRAARERVEAANAALIIEAIRAEAPALQDTLAIEQGALLVDRLAALLNLHKASLLAAGFTDPNAALIAAARSLGSKTSDPKYARYVVAKHLQELARESLDAADLAQQLPEPNIAISSSESPGPALEEFKTPTAQRTRVEGSGLKQRRGRADPVDLLERINGEILVGNRPLAAETVRLGTNAVRTLVRRGELSADEGQMIIAELRAVAAI